MLVRFSSVVPWEHFIWDYPGTQEELIQDWKDGHFPYSLEPQKSYKGDIRTLPLDMETWAERLANYQAQILWDIRHPNDSERSFLWFSGKPETINPDNRVSR